VKTLAVTAFAGTGHVLATALLGLLLTVFGIALNARVGAWFPFIAGALLISLGSSYLWRQFSGGAHSHTHLFCQNEHDHAAHDHQHQVKHAVAHLRAPEITPSRTSDRVAITSLFALLTLSPCEAFLPIYISGIRFGWSGFALLTLILSLATVAGMLFFTSLTLAGIRNVRLSWFERFESGIMGGLLLLVGLLVMFLER
jgi:ABC-type nickel/cobalt efflux system permease component RcnA